MANKIKKDSERDGNSITVSHPEYGHVKFTKLTIRQKEILSLYSVMKTIIEEAYKGQIKIKEGNLTVKTNKFKLNKELR